MNTTSSRTSKAISTTPSLSSKVAQSKMPTIAGITLPEIALLGAAGFVLWRNREKIETFLTDNGIDVPNFLTGDLSELIQSGVSLVSNKGSDRAAGSERTSSRKHDA